MKTKSSYITCVCIHSIAIIWLKFFVFLLSRFFLALSIKIQITGSMENKLFWSPASSHNCSFCTWILQFFFVIFFSAVSLLHWPSVQFDFASVVMLHLMKLVQLFPLSSCCKNCASQCPCGHSGIFNLNSCILDSAWIHSSPWFRSKFYNKFQPIDTIQFAI